MMIFMTVQQWLIMPTTDTSATGLANESLRINRV